MKQREASGTESRKKTTEWISYLPEIYDEAGASFLKRFLWVFQSVYEELTEQIALVPHLLCPRHADRETLEWLASWFGMEHTDIWDREQLIWLLENRSRIENLRGTRQYLEEMIWLLTGSVPYIVEYYSLERYKTDQRRSERLEKLYGKNSCEITVLLPSEAVQTQQAADSLHRILEDCVPAFAECRLVLLQPYLFLERYSYLGINSCLGGYQEMTLENDPLMPYVSVVGSRTGGRAEH